MQVSQESSPLSVEVLTALPLRSVGVLVLAFLDHRFSPQVWESSRPPPWGQEFLSDFSLLGTESPQLPLLGYTHRFRPDGAFNQRLLQLVLFPISPQARGFSRQLFPSNSHFVLLLMF